MKFTAQQIAEVVEGKIEGNPEVLVGNLAKIEEGKEGDLSFLANPKYTHYIYSTKASIVLVNASFKPEKKLNATLIRVEDAYMAFGKLLQFYNKARRPAPGISEQSSVSAAAEVSDGVHIGDYSIVEAGAKIGSGACISPQVFIGANVCIGENTVLHPGVKIYHDCVIGDNCTIHAGTVIGADGFGFAPNNGSYEKMPQIGNVVIENNVEIGANVCIDRATMGSTFIREGVKLDNLIQIAHNVEVGKNTVIASQSGVSGSTKIGKNVMMGGQVGLAGHLKIGDGVMIAAQSGLSSNVKDGQIVMGSPAFDIAKYRKSYVIFRNLTKMMERLNVMEKLIKKETKA